MCPPGFVVHHEWTNLAMRIGIELKVSMANVDKIDRAGESAET